MRSLATVVMWSVFLCICLSVGHSREPCKNSWIDQDAIWAVGIRNHVLGGDSDPPGKGTILGGQSVEKRCNCHICNRGCILTFLYNILTSKAYPLQYTGVVY